MTEQRAQIVQLGTALDEGMQRLGYVAGKRSGESLVYAFPPWKEVLMAVSFRLGDHNTVDGLYVVDPLVRPDGVRLVMPVHSSQDRSGADPAWHLGSPGWSDEAVTQLVDSGLKPMLRHYGNARAFAESTDDEYLADESPELAEAVAYMYFRAGLIDTAIARLGELAAPGNNIPQDVVERARWFEHAILAMPRAAAERLATQAASALERYGLPQLP